MNDLTVRQSAFTHFFTADTSSAPFWFVIRLFVGWQWLVAGWEKVLSPAWFGGNAGAALQGFIQNSLAKTAGAHPDVQSWYAAFLQGAVLPHLVAWSNLVAVGELLVGAGLILGLFTGIMAFFGFFMNLNYLLAGTVSTNPVLLVLALGIILAHRVAGHWGLDRFVRRGISRASRMRGNTA